MPDAATRDVPATDLRAALTRAAAALAAAGVAEAGDDARRLAAGVLDLSAAQMLAHPEMRLAPGELAALAAAVARRAAREPVARILGRREFWGRSFAISPATLDPRPDSETLIEAALALVAAEGGTQHPLRIIDVGTGSGCLLVTLLAELEQATGLGTDVSQAALAVARGNARALGVAARAQWLAADMLDAVDGTFDLLVANPPYIASAEIGTLAAEVRSFDPITALDGGSDGLAAFRRLVPALARVVPNGLVVLEVGHAQADAVVALLTAALPDAPLPCIHPDVAGRRRCVAVKTRN